MIIGKIKIKLQFKWFDFYIGLYYSKKKKVLYFVPFPMIVFSFRKVDV